MTNVDRMDLLPLPITWQAVIPERYLDEMGHMNVAYYTHLFSDATGGFFEHFGMDRQYLEANQAGTFALEAHIRYLSEVRVGKRVTIRTRALGRTEKRLHFLHLMVLDEDAKLAATCEFIAAHIDMTIRRMSPLPEFIRQQFDQLLDEHHRLAWEPLLCGSMQS